MELNEFQNSFINYFHRKGFEIFEPASLLSDAFPTNFTPSGGEEHLNEILKQPNPKKSFCTVQPCFRYQDIKRMDSGFHLPLFNMGVAMSVNGASVEDFIRSFLYLFDKFGLDREKVRVSIFKGDTIDGVEVPRDTLSEKIWLNEGIKKSQIVELDAEENYFLLRKQGYGGIKTELFYEYEGQWVELGVVIRIANKVIDKKLTSEKFPEDVVCFGIGTERWITIISGSKNYYQYYQNRHNKNSLDDVKSEILKDSLLKIYSEGGSLFDTEINRKRILRKLARAVCDFSGESLSFESPPKNAAIYQKLQDEYKKYISVTYNERFSSKTAIAA